MVAWAAAQVTGLPPKVEMVLPCMLSAISGVAIVAPMGTPLAMPLAKVMMSGSTPQCSMPNILPPVRPQAVCTSSQMNRPPYFRMIPTISLKIFLRRRDEPADALDRLGKKRGDAPLRSHGLNRLFGVGGALQIAARISQAERAAITVRVGDMVHAGHHVGHQPPARLRR